MPGPSDPNLHDRLRRATLPGMVALLMSLAAAWPAVALATPALQRVPGAQASCAGEAADGYCYEWRFARDPSLRLVAAGAEDSGRMSLFRRDGKGRYRLIADVRPALRDAARPGVLFWGYAWDVADAVTHAGAAGPTLSVAFAASTATDEDRLPPVQRQLVYLLLQGTTTQPDIRNDAPLRFERHTAAQIAVIARQQPVEVIDGTQPAIVAFVPTNAIGAPDDDGSAEGVAHTRYALQDTLACLAARAPAHRLVFADRLRVVSPGRRTDFRGRQLGQGFGAVLVRPGRPPVLVVSSEGPSTLQELLPEAAAALWQEPACQRQR